jgi:hypothetical protein
MLGHGIGNINFIILEQITSQLLQQSRAELILLQMHIEHRG